MTQLTNTQFRKRIKAGMQRAGKTGTRSGNPIGRPRVVVDHPAVLAARAGGATITALQERFGLSRGTVSRIVKEFRRRSGIGSSL